MITIFIKEHRYLPYTLRLLVVFFKVHNLLHTHNILLSVVELIVGYQVPTYKITT